MTHAPSIYVETLGDGPDLVLLHGWGLHGGVWRNTATQLAADYRVHCIDLPGFGCSAPLFDAYSVQALAEAVSQAVPSGAAWVGWSLGGMVALSAAGAGAPIRRLGLVATNARFIKGPDWPNAVAGDVLDGFIDDLRTDYRGTLMRFLALQAKGSSRAREELRVLRGEVLSRGEPSLHGLKGGLDILKNSDLRELLPKVRIPVLLINGVRDTLVSLAAAEQMAAKFPVARVERIAGAGHAPFLSHPDTFTTALREFLHE